MKDMKIQKLHSGFTLVELMVAITIFGIIMITVMSIFIFSSQMSTRVELGRVMQENIKSVFEDIAEEVRTGTLEDVSESITLGDCATPTIVGGHAISSPEIGDKLCLSGVQYAIGNKQSGTWERIGDISECSDTSEDDETICRILKREETGDYYPLTNNRTAVEHVQFILTNETLPKVTVAMKVRPAYKKGLSSVVIDSNNLHVQTTISERFIETD